MKRPLRTPEEILAYRSLTRILNSKSKDVWSASPSDSVLKALTIMSDKHIGFLVVIEHNKLIGVLSERDCVRRAILSGRPLETITLREIMTAEVITVDISQTFGDCLRLMHQHHIRHLPVMQTGQIVGVISVRDLLREAVAHHEKVIAELERERMTAFTSVV